MKRANNSAAMEPHDLVSWRRHLGLKKTEAATALGIGVRTLNQYEDGQNHRGDPRPIPRHIALACSALAFGLPPYRHSHKEDA